MKINAQLSSINNPTIPQKQLNKQDFEDWIDNGDVYYRQHQDQLEQSSLRFDSQPLHKQPQKPVASTTSVAQENPTSPSVVTTFVSSHQHTLPNEPQNTEPNYLDNPLIAPIIPHLDSLLNPTVTLNKEPISQVKIEKKDEIKGTSPTQPFIQVQFKNYHVFIQEQQVELTLNTEDLNPKDKKELMLLLKQHLKNKGFTLSQLIINGVHHD